MYVQVKVFTMEVSQSVFSDFDQISINQSQI